MLKNLLFPKIFVRLLAVLIAVACLLTVAGCKASITGGDIRPTDPTDTEPTQPPLIGCEGMTLAQTIGQSFELDKEILFTLPEFSGVQFKIVGFTVYVQQGEHWRYVLTGNPLFVADLNEDGYREFCTTETIGSGIIDNRICVYDFADDMLYGLHQRTEYDYDLAMQDGRLVALRYLYRHLFAGKDPQCAGTLKIEDRQLFFVAEGLRVPGIVESNRFTPAELEKMLAYSQEYIDNGWRLSVTLTSAINYYLDMHRDAIAAAIAEEDGGRLRVDMGNAQCDQEALRYLGMLDRLRILYVGHVYNNAYVYHDPANPAQLIVCTELRDWGYRDVKTYYEDLLAGKCQAHPDTYIVRLDTHAVYRWGEDTNLYPVAE